MLIAGVLCLGAAVISAVSGLWSLTRPRTGDPAQLVLRAVAPAQLAAALMLAAGGAVAVAAAPGATLILVIGVAGALGTLAAGSWQAARYRLRRQAEITQLPIASASGCCGGGCGCAQAGR